MKKYLKALLAATIALTIGAGEVNADAYRSINKNACETVYTNYYLFLDANTPDYFNNGPLSNVQHNTIAEYSNNYYQVNFDPNNVGYGLVNLTRTSSTSADGITSMSINDYYTHFFNASNTHGTYSQGVNSYISAHAWYSIDANGNISQRRTDGVKLTDNSKQTLINASLDANVTFKLLSNISPSQANPFQIRINRTYRGYLTGTPAPSGQYNWYLQPAVFYIQYCSPKQQTQQYTVVYDGNGSNVTNVPSDTTFEDGECVNISTQKPRRSGYEFLGWSTSRNATSPSSSYNPGSRYCGGNITLYAVWKKINDEPREYTVRYDGNGSGVSNVPNSITYIEGECINLSSVTPTRSGYQFLGWSTNRNATSPESIYNPGTRYCGESITLYAVWKAVDSPDPVVNYYSIYYKTNTTDTVTNMPADYTTTTENNAYISSNTPVRPGYRFLGWSTDAYATQPNTSYAPGTLYTDRKDLVLYAVWQQTQSIPENPKTGIEDYLLPFGGIVSASGLGLSALKKRKFRQF